MRDSQITVPSEPAAPVTIETRPERDRRLDKERVDMAKAYDQYKKNDLCSTDKLTSRST